MTATGSLVQLSLSGNSLWQLSLATLEFEAASERKSEEEKFSEKVKVAWRETSISSRVSNSSSGCHQQTPLENKSKLITTS